MNIESYLHRLLLSVSLLLAIEAFPCSAQSARECDLGSSVALFLKKWRVGRLTHSTFRLTQPGGNHTILDNVLRIQRSTLQMGGRPVQALHVWYGADYHDTMIPFNSPLALVCGDIGGRGSTQAIEIPVLPAREYVCGDGPADRAISIDLAGLGGFSGRDTSTRTTGIRNGLFVGGQVLARTALTSSVSAGIGAELLRESDRNRIPIFGHLRWAPTGATHTESVFRYFPDDCQFMGPDDPALWPADAACVSLDIAGACDSTVYFIEEQRNVPAVFKPYLFAEGGVVENLKFDGSGASPALNPEEYGQYVGAVGIGVPFWESFFLNIEYRMMRLNIRTPCEACPSTFIVNTNEIGSIVLLIGAEL